MREEKRILAILSFPGQRFLLSFNQFWTWLRKQGGVSGKATLCLAADPCSGDGEEVRGTLLELPLSLTPSLGLESSSFEGVPKFERWWLSPCCAPSGDPTGSSLGLWLGLEGTCLSPKPLILHREGEGQAHS